MKPKTKATDATEQTTTTGLKQFLSNLATDPRKLGEFLHEPEAGMSAANLSEADKAALRSGVAGMIAARLAGMPLDKAFTLIVQTLWVAATPQPQWMPAAHQPAYMQLAPEGEQTSKMLPLLPMMGAPQAPSMQAAPQYMNVTPEADQTSKMHPLFWFVGAPQPPPPQYGVYPPLQPPPPQYVVYPPQFVVQPPPQYVVYPPQFVVQPPPQYVVYPPQFVVQPPPYYPR